MGMAYTYEAEAIPPATCSDDLHTCRFYQRMRVSPAGGNRRSINLLVDRCRCGKIKPIRSDLTYWERRWVARHNRKMNQNPTDQGS